MLNGPTTIWHSDAFDGPDPLDPGHFNAVELEIVQMELTGLTTLGPMTLRAGDGNANGSPDGMLHTKGNVVEDFNSTTLADSFFDVFFEIEVPGLTLVGEVFVQAEAPHDRLPPPVGLRYLGISQPLLFDKNNPTGQPLAQLRFVKHTIMPLPTAAWTGLAVLAGMTIVSRLRRRRA